MDEAHQQIMSLLMQIKEKVDSIEEELLDLRDDFDEVFVDDGENNLEQQNQHSQQQNFNQGY